MDSVTPPDPTAVRRNAERIKNSQSFCYLDEDALTKVNNAARTVADAYLALTDPTPLTVEVLVEVLVVMGFVEYWIRDGTRFRCGALQIDTYENGVWVWSEIKESMEFSIGPKPRTAGELRQLLTRLEKR